MEFPAAALERLIKSNGPLRVSEESKAALSKLLEGVAREISARAWEIATKAKRKTLTVADVRAAKKEIWG